MRRNDRAQSRDFALALIDRCTHGVIAISSGGPAPYCLPLSFVRMGDNLYFHCAHEGRKVGLLRRFPRVMYTTYFQSVIVTGTASEVTDPDQKTAALRALCQKLTPNDMAGFQAISEQSLSAAAVWQVHMDEVSGKAKLEQP